MTFVLHGRPGRKPKMIVREQIPVILEELGLAGTEHIRRRYREKFGESVGWHTVARHLRSLVDAGEIKEQVITDGNGRNTVLYALKR